MNRFGSLSKLMPLIPALLLSVAVAGCGSSGSGSGGGNGFPSSRAGNAPGQGTGVGGAGRGPAPVIMGSAANFRILAQSAVSDVPTSAITGEVGLSPAAGTFVTGLTCPEVTGSSATPIHVATAGGANIAACSFIDSSALTTAVNDAGTAYTDANSRAPDYTELGAGNISGLNLAPATYKWSSSVLIASNLTLTGGPNDVWIFQIAQGLTVSPGVQIILAGGALPQNIYWATFAAASLNTTSKFKGTILSQTSIGMQTGATINGRLFAGTAVSLDQNAVGP